MNCCFLDLLGLPFKLYGRDKKGFDCYGLVLEVEKRLGHNMVDMVSAFSDNNLKDLDSNSYNIIKGSNLKKTDHYDYGNVLLFYDKKGRVNHVGVLLNNKDFIHCDSLGVRVTNLNDYDKKWEIYGWQK